MISELCIQVIPFNHSGIATTYDIIGLKSLISIYASINNKPALSEPFPNLLAWKCKMVIVAILTNIFHAISLITWTGRYLTLNFSHTMSCQSACLENIIQTSYCFGP